MSNLRWTQNANNQWQSSLLVSNAYSYDTAGQRLSNQISSLDPTTGNPTSRTEQYTYDAQNRLSTVDYGDGQTQSYSFDAMGNRLSKNDSVTGNESYGYNAANMLVSRNVGGTNNVYANDANGNTLSGGGRTNTWDSENRLIQCMNGSNTSAFTYGSDGLRHRSVVNGTTTDFVLDNSMFLREMSGSTVKATYLMGARGPEYRRDDTTGQVRWYLYDGLGSVLGEVDPNGNVTARRKYDVYGATRAGSDAGTSKHKFVGSLGHPSEDETGLTYMRARYYDPQTGRFVSEDSAGSGNNWYIYTQNNPTNFTDKSGRSPEVLAAIMELYAAMKSGTATYELGMRLYDLDNKFNGAISKYFMRKFGIDIYTYFFGPVNMAKAVASEAGAQEMALASETAIENAATAEEAKDAVYGGAATIEKEDEIQMNSGGYYG